MKRVNVSVVHILSSYGVMDVFCRELPPVNNASQLLYTTLNQLEQEQSAELATGAVHNQAAAWVVAGSGNFINLLQAQINVNWKQIH